MTPAGSFGRWSALRRPFSSKTVISDDVWGYGIRVFDSRMRKQGFSTLTLLAWAREASTLRVARAVPTARSARSIPTGRDPSRSREIGRDCFFKVPHPIPRSWPRHRSCCGEATDRGIGGYRAACPVSVAYRLGLECILMSRMPLGCPLGLGLSPAPSGIPSRALEVDA